MGQGAVPYWPCQRPPRVYERSRALAIFAQLAQMCIDLVFDPVKTPAQLERLRQASRFQIQVNGGARTAAQLGAQFAHCEIATTASPRASVKTFTLFEHCTILFGLDVCKIARSADLVVGLNYAFLRDSPSPMWRPTRRASAIYSAFDKTILR